MNNILTLETKKYSLKLENFEGPLDLLCHLVDKNKMDIDKVKNPIIDSINNLVTSNIITAAQGRSLKDAIKEKIKEHTVEHPVQKVMLDEIIRYYSSMNLLDDDELWTLKSIQSNRNGIHSFEGRTIGTWLVV